MSKYQMAAAVSTVEELRAEYVGVGGFEGDWNVILEGWQVAGDTAFAVVPDNGGFVRHFLPAFRGIATVTPLPGGLVAVTCAWAELVKLVKAAAIREAILVAVSGNLCGEGWDAAVAAGAATGAPRGFARRSAVGCHVGQPYWDGPE
jgi:hypothetical protein